MRSVAVALSLLVLTMSLPATVAARAAPTVIATVTLLAPITVGRSPFGVAVNSKTNRIYVANVGGCEDDPRDTVSVIDGSTDTVVNTITLDGIGPSWAAVNPRTNK